MSENTEKVSEKQDEKQIKDGKPKEEPKAIPKNVETQQQSEKNQKSILNENNVNSSTKSVQNSPQNHSPPITQTATEEAAPNQQHKKVEKIVGMKIENDKKYFLVKYAGQKELAVVDGAIIRKHNQKVLLNFYEENIKLVEMDPETAMQFLASKPK